MEGSILVGIYIFVLAIFVGVELISKVPPTLHTPLMSGANAISGIALVGAMVAAGLSADFQVTTAIGFAAVIFASLNVFGGYVVTDRMLEMFKKKDKKKKDTK